MAMAFALLVSVDPVLIQRFSLALRELSISPHVCQETADAAHLLKSRKFAAVLVDLQLKEQCGIILDELHLSSSNRTAVTFAISGSEIDGEAVLRRRTGFVFERPLSPESIRSTLKPAYGLILREWRRYFRHPISRPVTILRQNMPAVLCRAVNMSEGGMALGTSALLEVGENVQVKFTLPNHDLLFLINSTICWLKTGCIGVCFVSLSQECKSQLHAWLSQKLEETLPEFVALQFQKDNGSRLTVT
jgi:hypothetical protein